MLHEVKKEKEGGVKFTTKDGAMETKRPAYFSTLQKRAEEFINKHPSAVKKIPPSDVQNLIEDLQIHQVELEMQNQELRQAQLKIEAVRDKYTNLYDFAPVGYFTINDKRIIMEANLTVASMLGVERSNLIGNHLSKFITEDTADVFHLGINHLIKERLLQTIELRFVKKDGLEFNAKLDCTICTETGVNFNYIHVAVSDISQRKLAEEALAAENNIRTTLVESLPYPTMLIHKDKTVIFANKIAREVGAVVGGLCWRDFGQSEYIADEDKAYINQHKEVPLCGTHCTFCLADDALRNSKDMISPEVQAFGKIWETYWVPINEDVYLHFAIDVTERKTLEEQLQQASKMESIGIMAGGIAHDFNNLLYMITGNADLALEDIPEWNPTHANIKAIKTAGLRAAGIVKQLLNFSRRTGQKLSPIGAVTIIKDALKFLRATIPATVTIREHLPDTDTTVMADPIQINQILMNLCTNASQVMAEAGGILEITVEPETLTEDLVDKYPDLTAGEHLKITVGDTGPGIESEIIGRIFDPYFTTKEMGKGSGMGLAVVHGIVKNHNGAITVDSEPGKGATFTILFPVTTEKPEVEARRPDEVPFGNETILFVDDEEAITHMTGQILVRLGYKVETETSPAAALELFQSKSDYFDLIITDMTMPEMTGVKLSERLKGISPDIPVIICTGHSSLIDEENAKEMGIDGYVMKPIVKSDIAIAIRHVLDKGQAK